MLLSEYAAKVREQFGSGARRKVAALKRIGVTVIMGKEGGRNITGGSQAEVDVFNEALYRQLFDVVQAAVAELTVESVLRSIQQPRDFATPALRCAFFRDCFAPYRLHQVFQLPEDVIAICENMPVPSAAMHQKELDRYDLFTWLRRRRQLKALVP